MRVWLPLIRTRTGSEVYTRRLADGLIALGHDVVIDDLGHHFQYFPWLAPISAPKDAEVIVANSWNALAFHTPNIPLVTIVHHVVHDPQHERLKTPAQIAFHRFFVKNMENSAIRRSRRIIAVSQTTKKAIHRFIADRPVSVVLNGVDTDFFRPVDGRRIREDNEPIRFTLRRKA